MMAQPDVNIPTVAHSAGAEAAKIYEEGIVAGLIGAATIAVWFLILDAIQGRPLYTPTVLGTALFRARCAAHCAGESPATFELVLWFTWVHVLVFVVLGGAAAGSCAWPAVTRTSVLVFAVSGRVHVWVHWGQPGFAEEVLHALAWPAILIGNLLAAGVMAWYFWRRHPSLTIWP